jgi:hypothetical protein
MRGEPAVSLLVSVVVPTYNRASLVAKAIDSVLATGRDDLEVIVVDDGSTDETPAVLHGYGDRIRTITQPNSGRSAARNAGWAAARGSFVSFLDSDDLWEPWHLEQLDAAFAASPQPGTAYSAPVTLWDPSTGGMSPADGRLPVTPANQQEAALLGTVFALPGLFVPTRLRDRLGGFQTALLGSEDWAFLVALTRAVQVVSLPRASVRVRVHAGRSMADIDWDVHWRMQATAHVLSTVGPSLSNRERVLVVAGSHRYCAARLYEVGRMREARTALSEARNALGGRSGWQATWRLWLQTFAGPAAGSVRRWRRRQ